MPPRWTAVSGWGGSGALAIVPMVISSAGWAIVPPRHTGRSVVIMRTRPGRGIGRVADREDDPLTPTSARRRKERRHSDTYDAAFVGGSTPVGARRESLRRAAGRQGNLQVELTSFVGRAQELLEIQRLLAVARTVTLTGAGGTGKSRLALRAAHQLGRHFDDGVWWVELAEVDRPELVVDAVAKAVGAMERPGVGSADGLVDFLCARRLLLVLDNCEHLVAACRDLVTAIVSRSEAVRVLCTSRQRLGVPGESIVVVSPLGVPNRASHTSVTALREVEAVNLLVDRAQAMAPDFVLTDENAEAASEICRRLDGLPLAIELASVRLASLSANDLLARLDDRFHLLRTDGQHQSRRHQAIRATVEWSYDLLADEEQMLWRRVCVFAGSFGLAAVEAVCSGDGLEQDRIVDLLARLVDRSILTMRHRGRSSRYGLLETMRLYGAERLRESGEETALRRRHATWCAEMASGGDRPWWLTGGHVDFVDEMDIEWANVEAALEFCAGRAADAPMGLRLATDLWTYWSARGRYRRGHHHLATLLDLVPMPSPDRALGLWALGWAAQAIGDDEAVRAFEESRRVSDEIGADRERAYALLGLAVVRLRRGDPAGAIELLEAALAAIDQSDDTTGRAMILNYLGTALSISGKPTEAFRCARQALDLAEPAGDTMLCALVSTLVGVLEWQLGDLEGAEVRLAEAVRVRDRLDTVWGLVNSMDALAWVASSSGRLERSARLLGAVAALWRGLGVAPVAYWQVHRDRCVASVRAGLGEDRYRACFDQGAALDRREQVALALDDVLPSKSRPASAAASPDGFELTSRELEVARLVAEGLSNPAIASALYVSVATVKTHVSHILQKLALDSRVQLATWAAAHPPDPAAATAR